MHLKDFFTPDSITLALRGESKEEVLSELVGLLRMDERSSGTLLRIIQRRENLGSTGIGRGIAIPHCRSLVVSRLRVAFGHRPEGVEYQAVDNKPVLGKIAQFSKEPDVPDRLDALRTPDDFLRLLEEKGV